MKKEVFRIRDKVKIDNPEIFIRCGYPLTKEIIRSEFTEEHRKKVSELLKEFDIYASWSLYDKQHPDCVDSVLNVIASSLLFKRNFGGTQRTIHTEHRPDFSGYVGVVEGKKRVNTGIYTPGHMDYWSEEYDPPYLDVMEAHIILQVSIYDPVKWGHQIQPYQSIWIEQCHVSKVLT